MCRTASRRPSFVGKNVCFMCDNFADFVLRDVTLLVGLYAVMVNNCSGVPSNGTGSVRTFAVYAIDDDEALKILCGRCVLFSESADLPELSDVVLMAESTAQELTFNEHDDDELEIIMNHSGWSRPFSADHAVLAWSEQTQCDAARARHNRKYVR
jgi:hypothetical protein